MSIADAEVVEGNSLDTWEINFRVDDTIYTITMSGTRIKLGDYIHTNALEFWYRVSVNGGCGRGLR